MCWWNNPSSLKVESAHSDKLPNIMDLQTEILPAINNTNDYCKAPSTPLKRNRPTASKHIELTPLWQQIVQYRRLPCDVDKTKVFIELESRLNDPEWEVRQHALKFCIDLIPCLDIEDLNGQTLPVLLYSIVNNLGNPAPAVRISTVDVILIYLEHCTDPESFLQSFISQALESPKANPNLTLVALHCLPIFLNQIYQANQNIDSQILRKIVQSVSKKMILVTYQKEAVECLFKIKSIIGQRKFLSIIDHFYPQVKEDFDMLCRVYLVNNSNIEYYIADKDGKCSDNSSDSYSSNSNKKPNPYLFKKKQVQNVNAWNDDSSDDNNQSVPESRTFETLDRQNDTHEQTLETSTDSNPYETYESTNDTIHSSEYFTDNVNNENLDDDDLDEKLFGEDNLLYSSDVDDFLGDENDLNSASADVKRTPRRVTFGGEIVKLRTPDSDHTVEDLKVTIDNKANKNGRTEVTNKSPTRASLIPVPIFPALNKHKVTRPLLNEADDDSTIPTLDGGESLTSSSSSNEYYLRIPQDEHAVENVDLLRLGIVDRDVLDNLPHRSDVRSYARGLDRLYLSLHQPEVTLCIATTRYGHHGGGTLLRQILDGLLERKDNSQIVTSSLKCVRVLCQSLPSTVLLEQLVHLVPITCRQITGSAVATKLEAVECLKMLMRKLHPAPVINLLFTERCFFSKSSKMRESTLLCVMYALLTFPSTEFNIAGLVTLLLQYAPSETKKRVRQSLLDTFAVLAQFVPRSHLKLTEDQLHNEASYKFNAALQARLSRRQLPSVSPEGLILYTSRFPPTSNGVDHAWVRQGSGSWSGGKSTDSSNLLQSRRLSSSDPWMPRNDMTVRGVGALRYPSSGNLLGKDNGVPSLGSGDPTSTNSGAVRRSLSPSDRSAYLQGSLSDLQNGNLPLPPIPSSKSEDLFYQQQKDFLKILNRSSVNYNLMNTCDQNQSFTNSGQDKINEKLQKSEKSSNSQPPSPSIQRMKNSRDTSHNGHSLNTASNNNIQDKMTSSPTHTPKKSPNRTPTKLPKSIHTFSSQKSPQNSSNNVNNNSQQNNYNCATTTVNKSSSPKIQSLYPESLPPFEKPKEALTKLMSQMENSDWEASMLGIQGLVRMSRHHNKLLAGHQHAICTSLCKLVRSLRSQVARAACQAAGELFSHLGKQLEPELEDLAKSLLSRTADTNKFLRADSYQAMVAMVTYMQPVKCIPVILSRGAKHQSAIVRSSSCQLLLHIVHLYSPDKILCLPHELRNTTLTTAAKFLLEGRLETRTVAKELFIELSKDPKSLDIIRAAVPSQILTSCNKTLGSIFRK